MTSGKPMREALLAALRASENEWLNRDELATALGRRALNHSDVNRLNTLRFEGTIEMQKRRPSHTRHTWFYRALPAK
jgi:hypothetical protein